MLLRTFQFWPKSLYPDLTGVAILLVEFFKCWKYPSEFFWNIQNFVLSWKQSACFADFWILTKHRMFCGLYRRGHFFVDFLKWLKIPFQFFWNIQNGHVLSSKLISLKQKQHVLRTFQFWPKSLYPDFTGVAILLVDFFGWFCWNVENTLRILLKHSKFCSFIKTISLKQKTACFADFSILTKIIVSGLYRRGHFVGWFFWLTFSNVENTLRILLKHSKFCSFIKTISLKQKQHVLRTFQFWPKSLYPELTGEAILLVDFFGWFFCLIFWNVENTLRMLLKHSKFCCFIKTISLKQKQHVLRTFQFSPKSLYPDLAGVAILLVDFFGWFFEMLKIPFQFFWNIQSVVLSSKQSVWSKNSMFCGLFSFEQNRRIRTLPA